MSIRTRITLVGVGIVTLVICCLSGTLFTLISGGLTANNDSQLSARADAATASLANANRSAFTPTAPLAPIDPRTSVDPFTMVLLSDGAVLTTTGEVDGQPLTIPADVLATAARTGSATASIPVAGGAPNESVRVQVRRWSRPDIGLSGYVVAGQTSRKVGQDRAGLVVLFAVSGLITLVAAVAAVWVATGRALRPLRRMAEHADEVGRSQDLGSRLPAVPTRDAVGRLTTSFNTMMERLQGAYARVESALAAQQRFTADASHELRTPLTTVRNNAEFLLAHPDARADDREAALRDIAGEAVRMSRLIDNLLTLARADGGVQLHHDLVNLAELAESVCRQASAAHPGRDLSFAGTPAPPVAGDDDSLRQLLWILLDNAVKFSGDGGHIWVTVTQRANRVLLTVADDGAGIPKGSHERIFERFHRADPARSGAGAGLGLAIAAWIVAQHYGTIVAATNDRGGATFTVDLPVAPSPDEATVSFAPAAPA
jgi:two-component system OmpR family sensor kinase